MAEPAAPLIASSTLDLADVPVAERDAKWREVFVRNYDVVGRPEILDAQGRIFRFGQAVLTDTVQPRSFARDASRVRRDSNDNILISMELTGDMHVVQDGREERVEAGRITLFDVGRPITKLGDYGRTLVLSVPRELVEAALPGVDLHALTLGGSGALLAEHFRTLRMLLPSTPLTSAPALVTATLAMLAASVAPSADRVEQARPALSGALLTRAKRYIRENLLSPELTPDGVARAVGASRTSLYRAFEPEGGVADFIRRSRLEAARAALQDARDPRRIGEIAFAYGFGSEAQFSRAVRAAFGMTPTELRRGQGSGLYVPADENRWVRKPPGQPPEPGAEIIAWPRRHDG